MNKLEKRFENIIKENYNKKDFQNKLTFNFEKFEKLIEEIEKIEEKRKRIKDF